jgi:hypothetical protein
MFMRVCELDTISVRATVDIFFQNFITMRVVGAGFQSWSKDPSGERASSQRTIFNIQKGFELLKKNLPHDGGTQYRDFGSKSHDSIVSNRETKVLPGS